MMKVFLEARLFVLLRPKLAIVTLKDCKFDFLSCGDLSLWRHTQEYSFTIALGPVRR